MLVHLVDQACFHSDMFMTCSLLSGVICSGTVFFTEQYTYVNIFLILDTGEHIV